ncbi:MAG TPA: hypothetical protein VIX20_18665 [Ktedonobacteraceae bacterium]
MRPGSAYIINWNQVDLTKLCIINGKVVALSPIVPPFSLLSRNVVVSCIELENCSIFINPGLHTLNAPEVLIGIFNYQIVSLVAAMRHQHYKSALKEPRDDC